MKTIIEMAKVCQILDGLAVVPSQVERFAALVRADEREACAKVIEAWQEWGADGALLAKAIRARGNT